MSTTFSKFPRIGRSVAFTITAVTLLFQQYSYAGITLNENSNLVVRILSESQLSSYQIDSKTADVRLADVDKLVSPPISQLQQFTKAIFAYRNEAIASVSSLAKVGSSIKWAGVSPNGKYAVVGVVDPRYQPVRTAALVNVETGKAVSNFSIGEKYIEWCLWYPDSSKVAILAVSERTSLWPLDFFLAISGHPIKLQTYDLEIIDPITGESKSVIIAKDVKESMATLSWSEGAVGKK